MFYLDDFVNFYGLVKEHPKYLNYAIHLSYDAGVSLRLVKFSFFENNISYIRHVTKNGKCKTSGNAKCHSVA